ncbi:hypothetical protein [Bradyrhizobium sp. S3.5.5]|uniref:hypothetical protein n=1 Tax=Bradyrhizobium sp. S3.5.5 TaxID=3156430 RepID=UPI0033986D31
MRSRDQNQPSLFAELIERVVPRDCVNDAGVFLRPPPGRGWRVLDGHRERHTAWMRRRPVVRPWKRGGTC